ncbi:GL14007 [Drosophila persimilis]|uniref:GL14007 n=1 Tax=Drosophila persimilis TaxID=7234 RepID=B4GNF5_DROPE|nr:GL14007 [Drosophila persimilis]
MHVFVDASQSAFAAVAYWRVTYEDDDELLENYGLTAAECEAAEKLLVRQAQCEAFPNEMRSTEVGKTVASGSDIRGLAPYIDGHGVLRAYGRVDAALCMPYSASRRGCYDCGDPNKVLDYEAEMRTTEDDLSMQRVQVASGAGSAANNGTPAEGSPGDQCWPCKQWRIARLMRDPFWKRWVLEYLPTLVRREKRCQRTDFICDPALPRREWRKGIVEAVYKGVDGVIRRARG